LDKTKNIKIISRVGIGLDSVPLKRCKEMGIAVAYTPDAVTAAVVEVTIGAMIDICRFVSKTDRDIRAGLWNRLIGKRIGQSRIGIIGMGRIGTGVIRHLPGFNPVQILVNDIKDKTSEIKEMQNKYNLNIKLAEKIEIYKNCDIISLHIPLSGSTKNLINLETLKQFKKDSYLLNYSRGEIVNEDDLLVALKKGTLKAAAIDVFENEPYTGPLRDLDNILLTPHLGSCSEDCRIQMELQATENIIHFFNGNNLANIVPEEEYQYQESND
jgi:D-3-phosphoglycerate dehydrogenase